MALNNNRTIDHTDKVLENLQEHAVYYNADQYGLLFISGKDAESFLQSQLTNDIKKLKPGYSQYSCLLDRKAHLLAYFKIFRDTNSQSAAYYILAEKEQLIYLKEKLGEYLFAAQVELEDRSDKGHFFVVEGNASSKIFSRLHPDIYLPEIAKQAFYYTAYSGYPLLVFRNASTEMPGYFFWVQNPNCEDFEKTFTEIMQEYTFDLVSQEELNLARILDGKAKFAVDFDHNNLLPETGLTDQTVSFEKGCFTGQEILARVKSHGVAAQALIGVSIRLSDGKNAQLILDSAIIVSDQQAGKIKSVAFDEVSQSWTGFAMLKKEYRVADKQFKASINGQQVEIKVRVAALANHSNIKERAQALYLQAVQNFIQDSEESLPTQAIELLREALLLDPLLEEAYEALAVILARHEKVDEAIDLMNNLAQLNADSIMAHSNLSQFYLQKGSKEKAEDEKAIAMSIRMKLAAAQFSKEQAKKEENNAERARRKEMFSQVLTIDKEDFFANAGLGECLVAEGKFAEAIPLLKKAIELKTIHLPAYFDLAEAYKQSGDSEAAKETLDKAIAIATQRSDMVALQRLNQVLSSLSSKDS